jgi:multiple sugar transport system ATP-binding protein
MAVGDRLALIRHGTIVQIDTPQQIYSCPATASVAEIIGDPPMNVLLAAPSAGGIAIEGSDAVLPLRDALRIRAGTSIGVRARDLRIVEKPSPSTMRATVTVAEPGTKRSLITATVGRNIIRIAGGANERYRAGEEILIDWDGAHVFLFEGTGRVLIAESEIARQPIERTIGGRP